MEEEIMLLINDYKNKIEKNVFDEILHYYKYSEYEMALEGLLIEIISNNIIIDKSTKKRLVYLSKYFKLDIHSVFDFEIWNKFNQYINKL